MNDIIITAYAIGFIFILALYITVITLDKDRYQKSYYQAFGKPLTLKAILKTALFWPYRVIKIIIGLMR